MNQDSFANFGSMNEAMVFSKEHSEFLTVTCLEWKHVLAEDRFKDIIIDSLTYLTKSQRVSRPEKSLHNLVKNPTASLQL
jgi:hypothetical protein